MNRMIAAWALGAGVLFSSAAATAQNAEIQRLAAETARVRLAAAVAAAEPADSGWVELNPAPEQPAPFHLSTNPAKNAPSADTESTPPPAGTDDASVTISERGPLPTFKDTVIRDIKESPFLLWEDTKKVFGNPYNLGFLVAMGGASVALRPEVDDDIEDYYDHHHTFTEDWRDAFGAAGNPITHFAFAGAWYLTGQLTQDPKTYEVGKRMFSALTITGISTMGLKLAADTDSPNGESWAWPSGHVSSTMAFATVLNDAYGPLVGVPMFGLTGLVAIERLDSREHHFSDVVFGAALGWVVAETVMKEHRPEIFGGDLVPYVNPTNGSAGVAWIRPFGQ